MYNIYGNGWTGTFLPAVVLHKDKSAPVAVAVLDRSNVTADNSIGKALFKFVERVEALNLKDPEELSVFARCFCGYVRIQFCWSVLSLLHCRCHEIV